MISRWGCNTNNLVRFTLCETQMQLLKPRCIDSLGCPFIIEVKAVNEEIRALIQNQEILCYKFCFCFCTMCVQLCVCSHILLCTELSVYVEVRGHHTHESIHSFHSVGSRDRSRVLMYSWRMSLSANPPHQPQIFINRLYSLTLHGVYGQVVSSTHTHCHCIS